MLSRQPAAAAIVDATTSASEVTMYLEGEQRLESEHRPVAPAVHPLSQQYQCQCNQACAGKRASMAVEVVDRRGAGYHGERQRDADGDRDPERQRPLVLAQRLECRAGFFIASPPLGSAALAAVGVLRGHQPSCGRASRRLRSERAARCGSSASAIARRTTARRAPAPIAAPRFWRGQAADRKERHRRVGRRVADKLQADGWPARLGGRLMHRADADVVDCGGVGGVDLLRGVG